MSKRVLSASKACVRIGDKVIPLEGDWTFHIDEIGRRWSGSQEQLQELPRTFKVHDEIAVDYGEMERRIIAAAFPGEDGIGADIYGRVYQRGSETIQDCVERILGANPCLSFPYGSDSLSQMHDVIYANTHRAKVKQFDPIKDSAEIEFVDKNLIPPTMWVPTRDLRQAWGGRVVNTQTHCPKCEIPWKEVVLARFSVWDCPACGAKKEDHAR